jgi:hypothetical protein
MYNNTTIEQLRQAQAVVLPLRYGVSLEQTAQAIGLSKGWMCRLRNQFIAGGTVGDKGKSVRGGRHVLCLSASLTFAMIRISAAKTFLHRGWHKRTGDVPPS